MFAERFGLTGDPFGSTAHPSFLYFGQGHKDALSAVYLSALEGRGIGVLTASAGLGKTTLLRYLADRLKGRAAAAFFPHPCRTRQDLMQEVMKRVGLGASGAAEFEQMNRLQQRLAELKRRGYPMLLLFDEGQGLSDEALEQIRLLSNLHSTNLLEVIIAGQPELEDKLREPRHEALRQRISVMARVEPLREEEVAEYIRHRLSIVGRSEELFLPEAITLAAEVSDGIPRRLNHLCHGAMTLAWADDLDRVTADLILEASRDLPRAAKRAAVQHAGAPGMMPANKTIAGMRVGRQSEWAGELVVMSRYLRMLQKANLEKDLFGGGTELEISANFPPAQELDEQEEPRPEAVEPIADRASEWREQLSHLLGLEALPGRMRLGLCPLGRLRSAAEAAAALGQWIAGRLKSPVLIVEASFDSPQAARLFRTRRLGLAEAMAARELRWDHFVHDTAYPGLKVLPAGRNPAIKQLVTDLRGFREALDGLDKLFDCVIVSLPNPRVAGSEKLFAADSTDIVFPVIEPGRLTVRQAAQARRKLAAGAARVAAALVSPRSAAARLEHLAAHLERPPLGDHHA